MATEFKKSDIVDVKRGGFGRVEIYRQANGTKIARKVFDPNHDILAEANVAKLQHRFEREVKIQKGLSCDYIMPVIEASLKDLPPWFTMPYAERNFREFIQCHRGSNNSAVFLEPLCDILNGLESLHDLEYKHRDLKPENILEHEGKWKLSDFGLISCPDNQTAMLTSTRSKWGSMPYASREQLLDFANVTCSTDIYSFGCILHDIFDGSTRVPYQQQTTAGTIGVVIERCTAVDITKRFQNIGSLRSALIMALHEPIEIHTSPSVDFWLDKLTNTYLWKPTDYQNFCRFLRGSLSEDDQYAILVACDEDALREIHDSSGDAWNMLTELLCEKSATIHDLSFCDVVGTRLRLIFELGSVSLKSRAVIAAANMAQMHNRWFVMRIVMKLASPALDDNLARRIAVDIKATESEAYFLRCAEEHNIRDLSCYHSFIKLALVSQ